MNGQSLLNDVYLVYKGKIASRTPAWGSDKANVVLSIANRKIREWSTDPNNKWNSLFEIRALTPVIDTTTPVTTYNLATDFYLPSDYARVVRTDSSVTEYPIVKAQQRDIETQSLYIHGFNPKKVTFSQTIDTGLNGATLYIPGYYKAAELALSTDVVPVDDPNWLVYAVAAELARNDAAKDTEYPNIMGMANDLYKKMVDANNSVGFLQPNSINYNMPGLGDATGDDWGAA
jgi:hypothetical protein